MDLYVDKLLSFFMYYISFQQNKKGAFILE